MSSTKAFLPSPGLLRVVVMFCFLANITVNSLNYMLMICELFCTYTAIGKFNIKWPKKKHLPHFTRSLSRIKLKDYLLCLLQGLFIIAHSLRRSNPVGTAPNQNITILPLAPLYDYSVYSKRPDHQTQECRLYEHFCVRRGPTLGHELF